MRGHFFQAIRPSPPIPLSPEDWGEGEQAFKLDVVSRREPRPSEQGYRSSQSVPSITSIERHTTCTIKSTSDRSDIGHSIYNKVIPMSRATTARRTNNPPQAAMPTHFENDRRDLRSMFAQSLALTRSGVTIVEVLFSMFVVLFGLVGLVVLLPLAGRRAADSYTLTQSNAAMQNIASELMSAKDLQPTPERGWWYSDDSTTALNYGVADSVGDMYLRIGTRLQAQRSYPANQVTSQALAREAWAYGFCIDPLFCADQCNEGWRYATAYTHQRGSASQILFRRTRMPFFDEFAFLDGNFATGAVDFASTASPPLSMTSSLFYPGGMTFPVEYPRLVRVSFPSRRFSGTIPLALSKPAALKLVSAMGDLIPADVQEDKSFGSLRGFQGDASGFISAPSDSRLTWMITITPSERTATGIRPTEFNMSFVMMNRRDQSFDAVPLSYSGAEGYPKDEKIAIATSTSVNNATQPFWVAASGVSLVDLPQSNGSTLELKLWGAQLTDPTVRVGDWVMLSRRITLNDASGSYNAKLIHRHRWYRVIGTDDRESWPRVIRVAGDAWDYPEANVATGPHAFSPSIVGHLQSTLTTVTICPSVTMVYKKVVTLE